jgi:hypothetical protein
MSTGFGITAILYIPIGVNMLVCKWIRADSGADHLTYYDQSSQSNQVNGHQ